MPGIFCVVDIDRKNNVSELISRIAKAIKHEEWHVVHSYIDRDQTVGLGRVDTGILNPQPQPIFNEDKSLAIIMEGEVFDYQDLKQELIKKEHRFTANNDPEFVLHLYEELGEDFVNKLNGFFTIVIWDRKNSKLVIVNDRFGFRPLYYAHINGGLILCSEAKGILEDKSFEKTINERGVADFFTFGHLLGDKTLFKNISLLPPASIWTYQDQKLVRKQYWRLQEHFGDYEGSEDDFLEEFSFLFKQSVRRQTTGNYDFAVSLTGGLDSRAIFAAIDHKLYPVYSFTHGIKGCVDLEIAEKVAKKAGSNRHYSYELGKEFLKRFPDYAKDTVFLADGMAKFGQTQVLYSRAKVRQYVQIELSAGGADLTRGWGLKPRILASKTNKEVIKNCLESYKVKFDDKRLFTESFYRRIEGGPANSLEELYSNLNENLLPKDKANYFYILEHIRKLIMNTWTLAGNHIELRLPYWDNDLINLIIKAPLELLTFQRKIPRFVVRKNNPDLTTIPVVDSNYIMPFYESKLRDSLRHFKDIFDSYTKMYIYPFLPSQTKLLSFAKPYLNYEEWMRNELRVFTESILLDSRTLDRGYYDPEYVRKMISNHMARRENLSGILNLMIGLELFHRLFLD